MIFVLFGLLGITALVFLFSPLAFKYGTESRELVLGPYRRQLSELENEKERGVIDEADANSIRLEIERASSTATVPITSSSSRPAWRLR